jgi:hypothetical protein
MVAMKNMRLAAIALLLAMSTAALADTWLPPKTKRYCSADEKHCVEVIPKPISSPLEYFHDQVEGADNPGAGPDAPRTAQAIVYRKGDSGEYEPLRTFALLNEVAPVKVLVAADGQHFVTFDNWHRVGYGEDTVVIYKSDGTVVKTYSLEKLLTAEKVENLPHSVSSIWWSGTHVLDEERGHVVLKIVKNTHPETYDDLRLDLATGNVVK